LSGKLKENLTQIGQAHIVSVLKEDPTFARNVLFAQDEEETNPLKQLTTSPIDLNKIAQLSPKFSTPPEQVLYSHNPIYPEDNERFLSLAEKCPFSFFTFSIFFSYFFSFFFVFPFGC
jgi:hypothetical protein